MNRIKENEIYDKFQDLCNSHKEISHFGDKHRCNTECPLRDTNRCENVFFYQQGAEDFAKWLENNSYLNWIGEGNDVNSMSAKEALAEWQKGQTDGKN